MASESDIKEQAVMDASELSDGQQWVVVHFGQGMRADGLKQIGGLRRGESLGVEDQGRSSMSLSTRQRNRS
jgi:hypothetical protein